MYVLNENGTTVKLGLVCVFSGCRISWVRDRQQRDGANIPECRAEAGDAQQPTTTLKTRQWLRS